jgi:hypothetical protein
VTELLFLVRRFLDTGSSDSRPGDLAGSGEPIMRLFCFLDGGRGDLETISNFEKRVHLFTYEASSAVNIAASSKTRFLFLKEW